MEIVKFRNNKYAIRKLESGYQYKSTVSGFWFNRESDCFSHCVVDDINVLYDLLDCGTPINTDKESFWDKIKNNIKKLISFQDKVGTKLTELDEAIEERG